MFNLKMVEDDINRLISDRNRFEQGLLNISPQEYTQLNNALNELFMVREQLIQEQNRNMYSNRNTGYIDPRLQSNNSLLNRNQGFGIQNNANQNIIYPQITNNSNVSDNKYAHKAQTMIATPNVQPATQANGNNVVINTQVEEKEEAKPSEGSEYVLNLAPGLFCKKEEQNGWYRWEVYGKRDDEEAISKHNGNNVSNIQEAKKFCLENKLNSCSGILLRFKYGRARETNLEVIKNKLKGANLLDGILATKALDQSIGMWLDKYCTKIINCFLSGGAKKRIGIDDLSSDFDSLNARISGESIRIQNYFDSSKASMLSVLRKHIDLEVKDGLYSITQKIPYIYVDSASVLGNLINLMNDEKCCCVKEDGNPSLLNFIKENFDKTKSMHTTLFHIDDENTVHEFIVCKDILGNFIIAK